jgi:hypothetical protein
MRFYAKQSTAELLLLLLLDMGRNATVTTGKHQACALLDARL